MIAVIAAGIGLIAIVAIIVGIVDAAQAGAWRRVAAERRELWEAKHGRHSPQPEFHGIDHLYDGNDD